MLYLLNYIKLKESIPKRPTSQGDFSYEGKKPEKQNQKRDLIISY